MMETIGSPLWPTNSIENASLQEAIISLERLATLAGGGGLPIPLSVLPDGNEEAEAVSEGSDEMVGSMYRVLLEQLPVVTFMARLGGAGVNEIYVSPQIETLLGFSQQEWLGNPILWYERLHPDDKARWNGEFARFLMLEEPFRSVYRFLARDGRVVYVLGEVKMVRNAMGQPTHIQGIAYDITERQVAEEKFRHLLETAPDAMVIANEAGRIVLVNSQTERVFGYAREELLGQPVEILIPERYGKLHTHHRARYFAHPTIRPMGAGLELYARRKDGSEFPVEVSLSQLETEEGRLVSSVIRDISARKQDEQRILDSLKEKETLLKEIHHRVKNNLAVISSLFYLQSGYTQDEATIAILRESQDRVRSMALVHETLYQSDNLAGVNFAEYARALGEQLIRTYSLPTRTIILKTELDPVPMNIDLAVPCGLILNELLTNALKHAFPGGRDGEIRLSLHREAEGACVLCVTDNGVGLPAEMAHESTKSLGLRMMRSLTRQIDGKFELVAAHPGATARLTLWMDHDSKNH
ncbi:MAG TPA: PAS domain S-box protein [Chthonomonadaceae bacterium]|nr:PAS domain S-box protein [Chthonomonadaceae bacterium]